MLGDQGLIGVLTGARLADGNASLQPGRVCVLGKGVLVDQRLGIAVPGEIADLRRRQANVGRHPDCAELEGGPLALEQLVAVARMDQQLIALAKAAGGQSRDQRVDPRVDLGPGPGLRTPDQTPSFGKPPCHIGQQTAQIHRVAHSASRRSLTFLLCRVS